MDLCEQSNGSTFQYAVYVDHSFSSKQQASFNFMAAVTIYRDFEAQENKICHCFHCFPIYLPWSDGTGCHDLKTKQNKTHHSVFWMLSFKPAISLPSFTFIKRLFSSSSLSAIRVLSTLYLRLWMFLLAILIPACASSSLTFHIMYSACKLNKQGDNIQPWRTPFPILNQSVVLCLVLLLLEHDTSWFVFSRLLSENILQINWSSLSTKPWLIRFQ